MARIDQIRSLLEQDPANSRIHFMLCMEHVSAGAWSDARQEFTRLLEKDPNYVAGYYQAGRACEQLDDAEAARACYRDGIEAARRQGDAHSLSELQAALDILG
jgi:tetratricopeptide (TPR) repeat protein